MQHAFGKRRNELLTKVSWGIAIGHQQVLNQRSRMVLIWPKFKAIFTSNIEVMIKAVNKCRQVLQFQGFT